MGVHYADITKAAEEASPKMKLWLKHFLNRGADTFMNGTNSAKAAGYKCGSQANFSKVGNEIKRFWLPVIEAWMEEEGASITQLQMNLLELTQAEKTQFFTFKGEVVDERTVQDTQARLQANDMLMRARGGYAPQKVEHSGQVTHGVLVVNNVSPEEWDALAGNHQKSIEDATATVLQEEEERVRVSEEIEDAMWEDVADD